MKFILLAFSLVVGIGGILLILSTGASIVPAIMGAMLLTVSLVLLMLTVCYD
jgi:hypothetical protein